MQKPHYTIINTWHYTHTHACIHCNVHLPACTHAHTHACTHAHIHTHACIITYVKLKGVITPSGGLKMYVLLVTLDRFNHWQRPRSLVNIADPPESALLLTNSIFVSYIRKNNHQATCCTCNAGWNNIPIYPEANQ